MIRAVLDANIIVSGLAFSGGLQAQIMRRATQSEFEIVISDHLYSEVAKTLESPFFAKHIAGHPLGNLHDAMMRTPRIQIHGTVEGIATHPEDDLVLSAAVSGHADYLVTGDKQLLKLADFEGVRIVDSRTFLGVLDCDALENDDDASE